MQKQWLKCVCVVWFVLVAGCGDKKNDAGAEGGSNSSSYSGKFRYEVNGCDTGVHEFSSRVERCRMLADNELNHYCAESMRAAEYERACGGRMSLMSADGDGIAQGISPDATAYEGVDMIASQQAGVFPDATLAGSADAASVANGPRSSGRKKRVASAPRQLTLLAKLEPNLEVKTSEVSGSLITTLEGSFAVAGEGLPAEDIHLSMAIAATFQDLPADCDLSVRNFEPIRRSERNVRFTLVGIDSRRSRKAGSGCGPALRRFSRSGFLARFEQAYLIGSGPAETATVTLSVF